MKLALVLFVGACLLVVATALPYSSKEPQPGIPTSLLEEEEQQQSAQNEHLSPLAREKRHKKKVVIINQYYTQPRYHGYNNCPGCGGYYSGYPGYYHGGNGYYSGGNGYYPYGGYNNYGSGHGKNKKFG